MGEIVGAQIVTVPMSLPFKRDASLGRTVAIKTVHAHLLRSQGNDLRQRFVREAQAAAKSLHPNIVAIFDFGEQDGTPYIVMEFVEGQELKNYLRELKFLLLNAGSNPLLLLTNSAISSPISSLTPMTRNDLPFL